MQSEALAKNPTESRKRFSFKLIGVVLVPLILVGLYLAYRNYRSDRADRDAQSSVRHALVAAHAFAEKYGTVEGLDPRSITEIDSNFDYRDSGSPASGYRSASIFARGDQFAAAAYGSGRCFWIRSNPSGSLSDAGYASARSALSECVAARYAEQNFRNTSIDGWRD